jgi:hypothetical protein
MTAIHSVVEIGSSLCRSECSCPKDGLKTLDALTSTSSHELIEAITDRVPGQGWYDNANGEIGDICAWQTRRLDKYMIQLEWSNSSNSCK